MPPLYAIACLAFVILYINERLLVCYYYREPPAFDEKMTMLTLELVKWIPFIMLPMAFWQLGNRQIYENITEEIEFKGDVRMSDHNMSSAFAHMNPLFMTYNSGPMWMLILIISWSMFCWITGYASDEEEEDDQLVEGLADYYDALKDSDKSSIIGQEETFKSKYNVRTFSDEAFSKMKNSTTVDVESVIMGVATYRLLESLDYQQALQYEPARMKEDGTARRDNVILISTQEGEDAANVDNEEAQMDATFLAVNLAFVPDAKRETFNMDTSNGQPIFK